MTLAGALEAQYGCTSLSGTHFCIPYCTLNRSHAFKETNWLVAPFRDVFRSTTILFPNARLWSLHDESFGLSVICSGTSVRANPHGTIRICLQGLSARRSSTPPSRTSNVPSPPRRANASKWRASKR